MVWFNVDDGLTFHPKVVAAGNAAIGAWVRMGAYCACHLTDGKIPKRVAESIATPGELAALLREGMVRKARGGYQLHQYLDRNRSKAQVEAERVAARTRMQRLRRGGNVTADVRANKRRTFGRSHTTLASVPKGTDSGGAVPAPRAATCIEHMLELPCRGCAADKIAKDG